MVLEFSVVLPTRDRAEKTKRALDSIFAQTVPVKEIIIIDDASKPDSLNELRSYVRDRDNVRVICNNERQGGARSRNIGAATASGTVLAFLDSDDWWEHRRLEVVSGYFDSTVAGVYNAVSLLDGDRKLAAGIRAHFSADATPARLACWNFVGGCSAVCVRKEHFDAVGGFDDSLPSCQDWDLWLRIALKGRFRFIPRKLSNLDIGPHDRITTNWEAIDMGHRLEFERIKAMSWTKSELSAIKAHHAWTLALISARFGYNSQSLRWAAQSFSERVTLRALLGGPQLLLKLGSR